MIKFNYNFNLKYKFYLIRIQRDVTNSDGFILWKTFITIDNKLIVNEQA
jgi:hypothetical protein